MRFHVVNMPHTNTTRAFHTCAYTQKVRGFCKMMTDLGHEVYLYGGAENDVDVAHFVSCMSEENRLKLVGERHYVEALSPGEYCDRFNALAIDFIRHNIKPRDFICLIMGRAQQPIADAFPENMAVEFGVGYSGYFSQYKVFESYSWMHACLGWKAGDPMSANGWAWDEVIPNYLNMEDFQYTTYKEDYFLYLGRFVDRKGYQIAIDVCKRKGVPLKLAGPPPLENTSYGEYIGELGPEARSRALAGARALFVPTQYIEPFGTVAIEAMACGTPVICSDWGAFVETVPSKVGIRCKVLQDYLDAVELVGKINPSDCREWAEQFRYENIAPRYEKYFKRLEALWDQGWYQLRSAA